MDHVPGFAAAGPRLRLLRYVAQAQRIEYADLRLRLALRVEHNAPEQKCAVEVWHERVVEAVDVAGWIVLDFSVYEYLHIFGKFVQKREICANDALLVWRLDLGVGQDKPVLDLTVRVNVDPESRVVDELDLGPEAAVPCGIDLFAALQEVIVGGRAVLRGHFLHHDECAAAIRDVHQRIDVQNIEGQNIFPRMRAGHFDQRLRLDAVEDCTGFWLNQGCLENLLRLTHQLIQGTVLIWVLQEGRHTNVGVLDRSHQLDEISAQIKFLRIALHMFQMRQLLVGNEIGQAELEYLLLEGLVYVILLPPPHPQNQIVSKKGWER